MEGVGDGHQGQAGYYLWNGIDEVPIDVTRVRVAASVTEIREGAFHGRLNLVEVELPDGVRIIRLGAFRDCNSLMVVN